MQKLALSVAVLAAFLCIAAGLWGLIKRGMPPVKAILMIAVGGVLLLNAWLWATMPRIDGQVPQAHSAAMPQP